MYTGGTVPVEEGKRTRAKVERFKIQQCHRYDAIGQGNKGDLCPRCRRALAYGNLGKLMASQYNQRLRDLREIFPEAQSVQKRPLE